MECDDNFTGVVTEKLANMRAAGKDDAVILTSVLPMPLASGTMKWWK